MEHQFLQKREVAPVLEKEKIEQISRFNFNVLENSINTIPDAEEREQVMSFLNELKEDCQNYINVDKFYQKAKHDLQEVSAGDNEAREGALAELENWIFSLTSKKNVIVDGLSILSRLFESYGLDTSWQRGFANEQDFKEWVVERNKEL
ncbi:hypothetical protein KKG58_02700 [Patescibacteria group bacterium]|nr:hypothetical protein [Patescibacteria group bacterium]